MEPSKFATANSHPAAVADRAKATALQQGAAESVKRATIHPPDTDGFSSVHESPYPIRDFTEAKTVWHPIGV